MPNYDIKKAAVLIDGALYEGIFEETYELFLFNRVEHHPLHIGWETSNTTRLKAPCLALIKDLDPEENYRYGWYTNGKELTDYMGGLHRLTITEKKKAKFVTEYDGDLTITIDLVDAESNRPLTCVCTISKEGIRRFSYAYLGREYDLPKDMFTSSGAIKDITLK